jgi:hypothetical protein
MDEITKITYDSQPIQTYNILSFSGTKTYFANGLLVYEEHPPYCIAKWFFGLFKEKFPYSSTLFVCFTDSWHKYQFLFLGVYIWLSLFKWSGLFYHLS